MADKIFGADFTNESNPPASATISVNTGSVLVDVALGDLFKLSPFGLRNMIINGDFQVSQRGTSFAGLTTTSLTLDRWALVLTTLGTWTVSQESDTTTSFGVGKKNIKSLVTTADAAPAAGDIALLRTKLEGQSLQRIMKGTSSAKQITLSFVVKSSITGTFIAELVDIDNTRGCSISYTVNAANTEERKTIVFPADTTGIFDQDRAESLNVNFWLAAGSNFTSGSLQTTWGALTNANRAVGQSNLAASVNNYIQISGVQLEPDAVFTGFEPVSFDVQLIRCMPYYQKSFSYGTAPAQNAGAAGCLLVLAGKAGASNEYSFVLFEVPMRAAPTVTFYNPSATNAQVRDITAGADCSGVAVQSGTNNEKSFVLNCVGNASTAVGNLMLVHWSADAEL